MSRKKCIACLLALAGGMVSLISIPPVLRPARNPITTSAPSVSQFAARRSASAFSFPVTFEPNVGQAAPGVQFLGRGRELSASLVREGINLAISPRHGADGSAGATSGIIRLRLMEVKARQQKTMAGFHWSGNEKLSAESNYLIANDRRRWRTHVPHYTAAIAGNVLPGVGMKVYGNRDGVEYDLRLDPGIDPAGLRFELRGAGNARLDRGGDLIAHVGGSELRIKRPDVYEESPRQQRVDGGYVVEADGSIGFTIGPHDARLPLVIDPTLTVSYSTFLGGAGAESASSVGLDAAGNIYVSGTTTSPATFPEPFSTTIGPGIASTSGSTNTEYFIAKINPNASGLNSLVYLTFLGGSGSQSGGLITVDPSGNVAITGTTTSPDFPVTDGSVLTSGANDISVSEIDPTGSTLLFSTLFGGSGAESQYAAGGIAFDSQDLIYIASDTTSQDLPVTSGVFQPTFTGSISDGFLAVFQPGATPDLIYCSYLGANSSAQIGVGGVAVDASPAVYIAGFTANDVNAFPVKNAFQTSYGGDPSDAFLMKITPTGQGAADVVYATLLGGSGLDEALAVAVDTSIPPNAYVTGTTRSTNFPTNGTTAAYQPNLHVSATANAFLSVIALNPTTGVTSLAYSTYLGGSESDSGQSVVASAFNSVYIAGTAGSWNFPWYENLQPFNGSSGGSSDAFVAKIDPSAGGAASLLYATPLGGTASPGLTVSAAATALAADLFGDVSVVGQTTAADFPTAVTNVRSDERFSTDLRKLPDAAAGHRRVSRSTGRKREPAAERLFQRGKRDLSRGAHWDAKLPAAHRFAQWRKLRAFHFRLADHRPERVGFFAHRGGRLRGANCAGGRRVFVRGGIRAVDDRSRSRRGELHRQRAGKSASAGADRSRRGAFRSAIDHQHQLWVAAGKYIEPEPCFHDHEHGEPGIDAAEPFGNGPGRGAIFPEWQGHYLRTEPRRRSDVPDRRGVQPQVDWDVPRASEPCR
jgi:hypothetical protein